MFYDTFAIIYKAYHYKLVCHFDLWTTQVIFFDFQSLKWTHRQNLYFFFKLSFILCGYLNKFPMRYVRY